MNRGDIFWGYTSTEIVIVVLTGKVNDGYYEFAEFAVEMMPGATLYFNCFHCMLGRTLLSMQQRVWMI